MELFLWLSSCPSPFWCCYERREASPLTPTESTPLNPPSFYQHGPHTAPLQGTNFDRNDHLPLLPKAPSTWHLTDPFAAVSLYSAFLSSCPSNGPPVLSVEERDHRRSQFERRRRRSDEQNEFVSLKEVSFDPEVQISRITDNLELEIEKE